MAGLIKNVPVLTFGIVGNRGHNFPLFGHLAENLISPFQTNADCELIKEQNDMQITSEKDVTLLVNCADIVNEIKQPS